MQNFPGLSDVNYGGQTTEYAPGVHPEAEPMGGIADTYGTENERKRP